ncbi:hypothetical protein MAR_030916 [Mya arenaria]|uniref:Uncharacterized protein n=1 Tax=Mya arenaria TaxID=6604 RepID=A0ABY7F3X9_MYAAR|nr:hypothetical protein MAR_030916 [Mya arenaria]
MIDDNCLNTSRHRPVLCTLKLGDTISESNYTNADVNANLQINWNTTRQEHISEYYTLLQDYTELNNIIHSELGVDSIDNAYDIIRNKLNEYSSISLPRKNGVVNDALEVVITNTVLTIKNPNGGFEDFTENL